jgi:hypothetical protein
MVKVLDYCPVAMFSEVQVQSAVEVLGDLLLDDLGAFT